MQQNQVNVSRIGEKLAGHVTALAEMTELMGDATSTYTLRHLEPRLRQGLVRAAAIGVTSTGKSTAINALVGKLALPENPSMSTPIPAWIGYQVGGETQAEIYYTEDGELTRTTCDLPTFMKKYCYNIEDIFNRDRARYDAVKFGTIKTDSPLLRDGLTVIDTLGISATTVDDRKTIRVLKEGVDIVVFLTKNANLNMEERRFLYQYVLGCRDRRAEGQAGAEASTRTVLPKNLFLVYNDWFGAAVDTAFRESVRTLYRDSDLGLGEAEIEGLVKDNVFYINAFQGRLGALGPYPYVDCAPEGSTQEAMESFQELKDYEREELEYGDPDQLLAGSGIRELAEAIWHKAWQLCFGQDSVAVRRVSELVPVVDGVMLAADQRLTDINISITELEGRKERFAKLKEDDEQEQTRISTALMALNQSYERSFTRLLADITLELKSDCAGQAMRTPMPQDFKGQYRDFLKMDVAGREEYLKALLPGTIRKTYEYCTAQLLKALDERQSDDYKTPFAVMAETRDFIASQATLLNARIESLRELGAEELGAVFPKTIIVDELFKKLELDLEEKFKEIVANSCKLRGKRFEESMGQHVKNAP